MMPTIGPMLDPMRRQLQSRGFPLFDSLRLMLLKIGARVVSSVRRTVIHIARNHPWYDEWLVAARAWGAVQT